MNPTWWSPVADCPAVTDDGFFVVSLDEMLAEWCNQPKCPTQDCGYLHLALKVQFVTLAFCHLIIVPFVFACASWDRLDICVVVFANSLLPFWRSLPEEYASRTFMSQAAMTSDLSLLALRHSWNVSPLDSTWACCFMFSVLCFSFTLTLDCNWPLAIQMLQTFWHSPGSMQWLRLYHRDFPLVLLCCWHFATIHSRHFGIHQVQENLP